MRAHPTTQKLLLRYFIALCIKLFINFAAAKVHKAASGGGDSCPSLAAARALIWG
jgi:hypothetical protein